MLSPFLRVCLYFISNVSLSLARLLHIKYYQIILEYLQHYVMALQLKQISSKPPQLNLLAPDVSQYCAVGSDSDVREASLSRCSRCPWRLFPTYMRICCGWASHREPPNRGCCCFVRARINRLRRLWCVLALNCISSDASFCARCLA